MSKRVISKIINKAAQFKLPTLNPVSGATKRGALISYTYNFDAMMRQPVVYIDQILKGELPGNLPVQAPTKYELSINLNTARALAITVPNSMQLLADEVIE